MQASRASVGSCKFHIVEKERGLDLVPTSSCRHCNYAYREHPEVLNNHIDATGCVFNWET